MRAPRLSLRSARAIFAGLLAMDIVVLLAFSISKQTVTSTTSQPLPQAPAVAAGPTPSTTAAPSAGPVLAAPPPSPVPAVPSGAADDELAAPLGTAGTGLGGAERRSQLVIGRAAGEADTF